ncbi:Hypothetical_protein [Hexamita inflata]|uniref:Hypothetical_protein n=1 Tax=Hexamita inflata TaxID=28002 RepID=A0AA86R799_9EUKA|nr:Hypothetical protein HINF_LOCUS57613 [Hexamita inflata]
MDFQAQLNNYCAELLKNLSTIQYSAEQLQSIKASLKYLLQIQQNQPEALPELDLPEKTDMYQVQNYLCSLCPTDQQCNILLQNSPEDPDFFQSLRQIHRNVQFSIQHQQNEIFEPLIQLYNYAIQKVLLGYKQMIYELLILSGVVMDYSQLQISNTIQYRQQFQVQSVKQFQLLRLLSPQVLCIFGHMRENKKQLFQTWFQKPYLLIMKNYYLQNYVQRFTKLQMEQNQILKIYLKNIKNASSQQFYTQNATYPVNKNKQLSVFPLNYQYQFQLEDIQVIKSGFPRLDTNELNVRFSELQIAPVEVQLAFNMFPNFYLNLIKQIKIQGYKILVTKSNFNIPELNISQKIAHFFVQLMFEHGLQQKIFENDSGIVEAFNELFQVLLNEVRLFISQNAEYIPGLVLVQLVVQIFAEQLKKYDKIDYPAQCFNQLSSLLQQTIVNKTKEHISLLNQPNLLQQHFTTQCQYLKLSHYETLPPFFVLNSICLLQTLHFMDGTSGLELFRTVQDKLKKCSGDKLINVCQQLNSYYLMEQIFQLEPNEFLNTEIQNCLNSQMQIFVQLMKEKFGEGEVGKKMSRMMIEAEPSIIYSQIFRQKIAKMIE